MASLLCTFATIAFTLAIAAQVQSAPPPRLDADLWARRSLDVFRGVVDRAARRPATQPNRADPDADWASIAGWMVMNPLLLREPYTAEFLALLKHASAREPERARHADRIFRLLALPEEDRLLRRYLGNDNLDTPAVSLGHFAKLASLPGGPLLEVTMPRVVDELDAAARREGKQRELAIAYFHLARELAERKRVDLSNKYLDRLLPLIKETPDFRGTGTPWTTPDPSAADIVDAAHFALLMSDLGRQKELLTLAADLPEPQRTDLSYGIAAALAHVLVNPSRAVGGGDLAPARDYVDQTLRMLTVADEVEAILAAIDGKSDLSPTVAAATRPSTTTHQFSYEQVRLQRVLEFVARGHAFRGELDVAVAQLERLASATDVPWQAGERVARFAIAAGRTDEVGRVLLRMREQQKTFMEESRPASRPTSAPAGSEIANRFVREAIAAGRPQWLMIRADAPPPRVRLAQLARERGDMAEARRLLDAEADGLRSASRRSGAEALAHVAVELAELGDSAAAERVLMDAPRRVSGEDFGTGGTRAIIIATLRMGRPELLDRIYDDSVEADRFMLSLVASGLAAIPPDEMARWLEETA